MARGASRVPGQPSDCRNCDGLQFRHPVLATQQRLMAHDDPGLLLRRWGFFGAFAFVSGGPLHQRLEGVDVVVDGFVEVA